MIRTTMSPHLLLAIASLFAAADRSMAQGSAFTGRVLTDSGLPLAGAEIAANAKRARSNAKGEFKLTSLVAGEHLVLVRMPGYSPKADTIEVADAGEVRREYRLSRTQAILPEVRSTATLTDRRLEQFYSRKQFGMGRFLDSTEFANTVGMRTSDRLRRLPSVMVGRGRFSSEGYIWSSRGRCAANVWMDGLNLGTGFDVNTLDPGIILAIEWYPSPGMTPVEFSMVKRGASHCAVLVIWTK